MSSERSVVARNADWDPWNPPNGYFNFFVPHSTCYWDFVKITDA